MDDRQDSSRARNGNLRARDVEANIVGDLADAHNVDRQPSPVSFSRLTNLSQRPPSTANSRATHERKSKKGQHAEVFEEKGDPRMTTENEKLGTLDEGHPLGSTEQVDHTLPADKNPWTTINHLTKKYDMNMCNAYRDEIQNVLIFAGLFSAVTTSFCVESYTFLSEDPSDATLLLLNKISDQLAAAGQNVSLPNEHSPFEATSSSVRINIFWFGSLCLSLAVVLLGTLCLQWLREYQRYHSMSPREIFAVRNMRFEGLKAWKIPYFVGILPILLQAAVMLFFAGLVELLWRLNHQVAFAITVIVGFAVCLFAVTTLAPAIQFILDRRRGETYLSFSQCPYKSPQSWIVIQTIRRGKKLLKRLREHISGTPHVKSVDVTRASGGVWFKHDIRWIRKRRTTSENLHFDIISGLDWVIKSFRENSEALQAVYSCFRDYSVAYNAPKVCTHITRGFFPDLSGTDLQVTSPHGDGQEKTNHIILDVTSAYLLRYLSKLNVSFNNASLPHRVELYMKLRSTYWHRLSSLGDTQKYICPSPYDLSHEIGADLPEG
ncbi:hypothetical protein CVT24_002486 [Panaeolus cyanescens]|uniref:DUF6535 domain-containing protein n=1 Tax=Panaeolus cyanescens TaxID=181874 RepID=A0A409YTQ2_9AGAR|nr:hypothetical protein CVT24_002486 [Panaeolus cyanescens]